MAQEEGAERARSPRRHLALALTAAALLLTGCFGGDDDPAPAAAEPIDLDVLVYNIEYGGGPDTDRVMRRIDADVVGVLESYERLPEIAENTGYPYYNSSLQLLSKYPILEPSGAEGLYALIEVQPGYVVPFFNVHLDYVAWGPRALRNGNSVDSVIASENEVRTSAMKEPIAAMQGLLDEGYPIFLTGDFNQPSSLDEPIAWPVSEELLDLGFRDSYRDAHPDPKAEPGVTHRSGERIDYVYAAGPSTTVDSQLVGEAGDNDVDIGMKTWSSDHYAVLSSFEVTPAPLPTLIAVDARLGDVGDTRTITYNAPEASDGQIEIVADDQPDEPIQTLEAPGARGEVELDTSDLAAGTYDAVLTDSGGEEIASVTFQLRDPEAAVELTTDKRVYDRGEPIEVSWNGSPANRWDWLGVFDAAADDPENDDYLIWAYTAGHSAGTLPPTTDGGTTLGPESQGAGWPLSKGDYVIHYLLADQYESAATAEFSVR